MAGMTDPIGSPLATEVSPAHDDPRRLARRLGRELAEIAGPFDIEVAQARLRGLGLDAEPGPLLLEVGQGWCDARDVRAEDFEGAVGIDLTTLAGPSGAGEAGRSGPLTIDGAARGWTLHDERGADMVGVVLDGRFEIVERIGRGGMGWVFRCDDLALHGQAAVKVLMSRSAEARRRFADEARLLANVRHPGLVKVLATGTTEEGAPYLAMEYLGGTSLERRLKAGGPLPWREVVEIGVQVAEALAGLHAAGVIHRDVKPANIVLLEATSARPMVKLIDLGVAKVLDWSAVGPEVTSRWKRRATVAGEVVGTHGYCAPEAGLVEVDARFDVFGLGVTLYQLCTGARPVPGEFRAMREVRPEGEFPAELEAVVAAAVAVDPEERIGSAVEFGERLRAIGAACEGSDARRLFAGCLEVLEALGTGAKAQVFHAYDRVGRRHVALKVLGERGRESAEERERFAREAQVLGTVKHAALPSLVFGNLEERPFLVMSLAPGRPAVEFCLAGSTLRAAEVVAVGRQVGGALAELHAAGVLHRDVNAANVLVERGAETRATLVDFGMVELAPRFYEVVDPRYLTPPESRVSLGTGGLERLEWTAPEARAGKGWSGKCDVFSLGVVMFRVLTGKMPFERGRAEGSAARPVLEVAQRCPRGLAYAIDAALAVDPAMRPDAAGLVEELEGVAAELAAVEEAVVASVGEGSRAPVVGSPTGRREAAREVAGAVSGARPTARGARGATSAEVRRERWRWRAIVAVGVFGLVYVGFLVGVMVDVGAGKVDAMARAKSEAQGASVASVPASEAAASVAVPAVSVPAGVVPGRDERLAAGGLPVSPRAALEAAVPALRGCASMAGEAVMIEVSTEVGSEAVATSEVLGHDADAVGACVRTVAAGLRFAAATKAETITKEVQP